MAKAQTIDGFLKALESASKKYYDDGFVTVVELSEATGHSEKLIYKKMRQMIASGKAEAGRVKRHRIDGLLTTVPAYRIKK